MIKASEVRKKTTSPEKLAKDQIKKVIEPQILQASKKGEAYALIDLTNSRDANKLIVKEIIEAGYKLDSPKPEEHSWIKISW